LTFWKSTGQNSEDPTQIVSKEKFENFEFDLLKIIYESFISFSQVKQ